MNRKLLKWLAIPMCIAGMGLFTGIVAGIFKIFAMFFGIESAIWVLITMIGTILGIGVIIMFGADEVESEDIKNI